MHSTITLVLWLNVFKMDEKTLQEYGENNCIEF